LTTDRSVDATLSPDDVSPRRPPYSPIAQLYAEPELPMMSGALTVRADISEPLDWYIAGPFFALIHAAEKKRRPFS